MGEMLDEGVVVSQSVNCRGRKEVFTLTRAFENFGNGNFRVRDSPPSQPLFNHFVGIGDFLQRGYANAIEYRFEKQRVFKAHRFNKRRWSFTHIQTAFRPR